ncbi:hypothetical protein [Methanogenium organophilum]|uniref:Uncharacterized protein n=1 Tax=Methanogenium organophilum TaxID=2199 RepID=A0A9X9T7D1_METOG|nr:hypothetical protein [Methanogenium organophilum]WAI00296.1 hypothetical protein OU421_07590 [Methanogenium organophilum]
MISMEDLWIYLGIAVVCIAIGCAGGYYGFSLHFKKRFLAVADECRDVDSIEPLIDELERQS